MPTTTAAPTYVCRFCEKARTATAADLDAARADQAEAMKYDGDLIASDDPAELMDRFGRDICTTCVND